MSRHVRLRELVLGVEGLALIRNILDGDDGFVQARVEEIRSLVSRMDDAPLSIGADVAELDPDAGYAAWSRTYDSGANPLIETEQPLVQEILGRLPAGRALDAACGTGRHAAFLCSRGHDVVGVDASDAMLAAARAKVPEAGFALGSLTDLPVETGSVDLVVCALALTHLPQLAPAFRELSRVVRLGGRVVTSDIHPALVSVLGQALFGGPEPGIAFVRNHLHLHSAYLEAFFACGLRLLSCREACYGRLAATPFTAMIPDANEAAWVGMPAVVVWELERGDT